MATCQLKPRVKVGCCEMHVPCTGTLRPVGLDGPDVVMRCDKCKAVWTMDGKEELNYGKAD